MTNKEKYRRFLKRLLFFSIIFTLIYTYCFVSVRLPDKICIVINEQGCINMEFPMFGSFYSESSEVMLTGKSNVPKEEVYITGQDSLYIEGKQLGEYALVYRLFGWINFKNIPVTVVEEKELLPCGMAVGLHLKTNGVLVIGTADLVSETGETVSPVKNKLLSGDYITQVNHQALSGKQELMEIVKKNEGRIMTLTILRNDKIIDLNVQPVKTLAGVYQLGVWVRDDCQGIGTLTFIDSKGSFGALGHAISDTDIGTMIQVSKGALRNANIHSIVKGSAGSPGSLAGSIGYQEEDILGTILKNTKQGVFGTLNDKALDQIIKLYQESNMKPERLPVAYQHEVKEGTAYIRSCVSGKIKDYEIRITNLNNRGDNNKGITFKVVDPELLDLTGGIVQGMSGSPIIQNGKIVGAVTHVFIQDAAKGYGIFIEMMLGD